MREQAGIKIIAETEGSLKNSERHTRRRWSEEQKRQWLEKWQQSGASRMAFCREAGLCYGTFLKWTRETAAGECGRFVEVKIAAAEETRDRASEAGEIISPHGWRLRLPRTIDSARLREILLVLAAC